MKMTYLGHAGVRIDCAAGSVLCDPWTSLAYFGSWVPYPDNAKLRWREIGDVDYLYISHTHRDHLDLKLLQRDVSKSATVLLPDFPTNDLESLLRGIGFTKFHHMPNGQVQTIGHAKHAARILITALVSPADGPVGDSYMIISDAEGTVLNMNDARPSSIENDLKHFPPVDFHLLQYSGAIWYPDVYEIPATSKHRLLAQKRERGLVRAFEYCRQVGAAYVLPSAGPPAFIDPELMSLNDTGRTISSLTGEPNNQYPDQLTFLLEYEKRRTADGTISGECVMLVPGSTLQMAESRRCQERPLVTVSVPMTAMELFRVFWRKQEVLDEMRKARRDELELERSSRAKPLDQRSLFARIRTLFEDVLSWCPEVRRGVGSAVLMEVGKTRLVIDFVAGTVRMPRPEEKFRYGFRLPADLVATVLRDGEPDWCGSIFLSNRFSAWRIGRYNEFLYAFFSSLSEERIRYVEAWYSARSRGVSLETICLGGVDVPRWCPHAGADLREFGKVVDTDSGPRLVCSVHGWEWDAGSGECLTADGHKFPGCEAGSITDNAEGGR